MSESYQTTFWEITETGRAYRRVGCTRQAVRECTRQQFRTDPQEDGDYWTPFYRRIDTGELATFEELPIGASWINEYGNMGGDGECLVVLLPGRHTWYVDGRCRNCGRPGDKTHRCWIRHGDPRQCNVTVDKAGDTCSAGAGSIVVDGWHGFLRNGVLVPC